MTIDGIKIGYENEKEKQAVINHLDKCNYEYDDYSDCGIIEVYDTLTESSIHDIVEAVKTGRTTKQKNSTFDTILSEFQAAPGPCSYLVEMQERVDDILVKTIVWSETDKRYYVQVVTSLISQDQKVNLWLAQDEFIKMRLIAKL